MKEWMVEFYDEFLQEFEAYPEAVQDGLLETIQVLIKLGPNLGRPFADTLNASKHSNMKELRFDADNGVWRAAFAFDPKRKAIVLVAGNKAGANQKRFYKQLIKKADSRFDKHLEELKEKDNG